MSSGVTLCAKTLFGATSINTDWRKNTMVSITTAMVRQVTRPSQIIWVIKTSAKKLSFLLLIGSIETTTWMVRLIASGRWRHSTIFGRTAFSCRWTASRSIPSASIFSLRSGLIFRTSQTRITTCANPHWPMIHLRNSMILSAMASGAAASVCTSIGITGRQEVFAQSRKGERNRTFRGLKIRNTLSRR